MSTFPPISIPVRNPYRITRPVKPTSRFESQWGRVTGKEWIHLESARLRAKGVPARVTEVDAGLVIQVPRHLIKTKPEPKGE